jgi:hypothetical protein
MADGGAAVAGAEVTLDAVGGITYSSFTGALTGTTNASGEVTFTLTNTNADAEPRPVAPSTMDYWDDSRTVATEYKFDMTPSVTGAVSINRDRIWTHIVQRSGDTTFKSFGLEADAIGAYIEFDTDTKVIDAPNAVSTFDVLAETTDADATFTVNGMAASNGVRKPVALSVGANTITVVVTAADGVTTHTYTVTVNRAAAVRAPITIKVTGGKGMIKVNLTAVNGKTVYVTRQNGADKLKVTRKPSSSAKSIVLHPRTKGTYKVTVRVGIKNVTFTVKVS